MKRDLQVMLATLGVALVVFVFYLAWQASTIESRRVNSDLERSEESLEKVRRALEENN